jgi:hypothetical protein
MNEISTQRTWRQIGLRRLLILMLCAATWLAYATSQLRLTRMVSKQAMLRELSRDLVIDNPSQFAIVALDSELDASEAWECYVPDNGYELCLATRDIDLAGYPAEHQSVPIPAGRYLIAVKEQTKPAKAPDAKEAILITVQRDRQLILEKSEAADWLTTSSSNATGQGSLSQQYDGKTPIDLLRKRIQVRTSPTTAAPPTGPSNGVLLWIQRMPSDDETSLDSER